MKQIKILKLATCILPFLSACNVEPLDESQRPGSSARALTNVIELAPLPTATSAPTGSRGKVSL